MIFDNFFREFLLKSCTGNPRAQIPKLLALYRIVRYEISDTDQDHVPIYGVMEEGSAIGEVTLDWEFVQVKDVSCVRRCRRKRCVPNYFSMLCVE